MTILAKKGFISSKPVSSISNARLHAGIYYSRERRQRLHQLLLTVFKTSWFISTLPDSLNSRIQHVSR